MVLGGSVMRDLRTGDDEFENMQVVLRKSFAEWWTYWFESWYDEACIHETYGWHWCNNRVTAKSGLFTGLGKGAATKQAAKEVVEQGHYNYTSSIFL